MKTRFLTAVLGGAIAIFVASGCNGQGFFQNRPVQLASSPDVLNRGDTNQTCAFDNHHFVLLGKGGTLHCSTDGSDFDAAHVPVTAFVRSVTSVDGRFVAVGGSYLGRRSVILTSENGRSWTFRRSMVKEVLHAVAHGGGRFVAVGDGGVILTSRDGRVWKRESSGTSASLASVAFGKKLFAAGGDDGLLMVSSDGTRWIPKATGTHSHISHITFHGDGFYASSSLIRLKSSDGIVWQPVQSGEDSAQTNSLPSHNSAPKF